MIYFLVYLFLEVIVSVQISSAIGGIWTFVELLVSAFIGFTILVNFRTTLAQNFQAVASNCMSLDEFQKLNLFTLLGAILLILPGFLSDIIGILLQFSVFTDMLVVKYNMKKNGSTCSVDKSNNIKDKKNETVIDVEVISEHSSNR
ncbi:MAG: FxsA family protein [Campylobacterota bacterium]|nr:FxsA family protein [Campylobacterota bacterium]